MNKFLKVSSVIVIIVGALCVYHGFVLKEHDSFSGYLSFQIFGFILLLFGLGFSMILFIPDGDSSYSSNNQRPRSRIGYLIGQDGQIHTTMNLGGGIAMDLTPHSSSGLQITPMSCAQDITSTNDCGVDFSNN